MNFLVRDTAMYRAILCRGFKVGEQFSFSSFIHIFFMKLALFFASSYVDKLWLYANCQHGRQARVHFCISRGSEIVSKPLFHYIRE